VLLDEHEMQEDAMFDIHTDKIGNMAVVECEGSIVRSDAAFKLRDAVTSQADASIVVLDLSEISAIEGGGLGMLVFLQRWAHDHDIRFKLFNPSRYVREKLEIVSAMSEFDIASLHEMMALLGQEDRSYRLAA
jgi:anti-anti-sigma regulatory factor